MTADNDGWIEWSGGERPVAGDTVVSIVSRSGLDPFSPVTCMAHVLNWRHSSEHPRGDIVQYRVIKQGAPAKEETMPMTANRAKMWLVAHFVKWPIGIGYDMENKNIFGWKWALLNREIKFLCINGEYDPITKKDWLNERIKDFPSDAAPASNKPTEEKQDAVLQYLPVNLARIKELTFNIEMAEIAVRSIDEMRAELAERTRAVSAVLRHFKFAALHTPDDSE